MKSDVGLIADCEHALTRLLKSIKAEDAKSISTSWKQCTRPALIEGYEPISPSISLSACVCVHALVFIQHLTTLNAIKVVLTWDR